MARLAYLGTPELAVYPLQRLVEAGHDIALVVSRPDAKRGRGSAMSPSPVKQAALDLGLPVSHHVADLFNAKVELCVVVAYGELLPGHVVNEIPMLNLHFSDLPRWRGAAPVERAVLEGDETVGVCVMKIVEELDAGPVYARSITSVGDASVAELFDQLSHKGSDMLLELLEGGFAGLPEPCRQDGEVTYAKKVKASDLYLDVRLPAEVLLRRIRVGKAWILLGGERFMVHEAQFGEAVGLEPGHLEGVDLGTALGSLRLMSVQPAGRKIIDANDWRRGAGAGVTRFDGPGDAEI